MASTQSRLRTRSLSDSDRSGRPQPARFFFDAPKLDGTKRAAVPRATSTSNMYNAANMANMATDDEPEGHSEDAWRDIAREQVDRETIRELAQFFRSTAPPTAAQHPSPVENCFGMPGQSSESRRWSIRSLRKGNKRRPQSASTQLRDSSILRTTAAGHSYMAISVPQSGSAHQRGSSLQSQSRISALQRPHTSMALGPSPAENEESQHESASSGMQSPTSQARTSQASSKTHTFPIDRSRPERNRPSRPGDMALAISRSSSRVSKDSYSLSIRVSTAERGVRSFLGLVDEWLEDQNTEPESHSSSKEPKVTVMTPTSEVAEEEHDAAAPKITLSSSSSQRGTPEPANGRPVTPPQVESRKTASPDLVPGPDSSLVASPKSPDSGKLPRSAFPPRTSSRGSPRSPKAQKKPDNILVKPTLEVPGSSVAPESPGFPAMLATMTFPSPPESIASHSANNSISSTGPNRSLVTPPLTGRSSAVSPPPSNLDQRLMQPSRPPLRQCRSDGAAQTSYMSQRSIATSVGTYDAGSAEVSVAQAAQPYYQDTARNESRRDTDASATVSASDRRGSLESSGVHDGESREQSTVGTVDSSSQSTRSDPYRHSLRSDTSAASNATATTEARAEDRKAYRDSAESTTLGSEKLPLESKRSSISSSGTTSTATSLKERRMARRARVREKLQRDLDASKANLRTLHTGPPVPSDAMDSPVLGWFPQNAPAAPRAPRRASAQGPSPLAQQASTPGTPTETSDEPSSHVARKSSVQDITQLIPETVEEATTPVTPTAPNPAGCTLSPIMVEATAPGPGPQEPPRPPALTISPIMVVANIEARSPSTLRPLSLVANGSSPPSLPRRSSRRPDNKSNTRQRPLPIRVTKNTRELSVNTDLQSKRNSSPHMPTPPISPDISSSPRMSMPLGGIKSAPARTSAGDPLGRSPEHKQKALSSGDKETQWLTEHQRQTAHDWRLAALRERMRREKLEAKEKPPGADRIFTADVSSQGEDEDETDMSSEVEKQRQHRAKHTSRSLRALNANATTNSECVRSTASNSSSDDDKTPTAQTYGEAGVMGGSDDNVEQRFLHVIMPLLENMNSTLREMQKDRVGRELPTKFVASSLATVNPEIDGGKRAESYHPSSGLAGPRTPIESGELPSATSPVDARKHPGRCLSMPSDLTGGQGGGA